MPHNTIPYLARLYHTILYNTIPLIYYSIPCRTIAYHAILCHTIPYYATPLPYHRIQFIGSYPIYGSCSTQPWLQTQQRWQSNEFFLKTDFSALQKHICIWNSFFKLIGEFSTGIYIFCLINPFSISDIKVELLTACIKHIISNHP